MREYFSRAGYSYFLCTNHSTYVLDDGPREALALRAYRNARPCIPRARAMVGIDVELRFENNCEALWCRGGMVGHYKLIDGCFFI